MTIKLIVIVSLAAVASSNVETPVAFGYNIAYGYGTPAISSVPVVPALPATFTPYADLKPEETAKKTLDPAITYAYDIHKLFLKVLTVKPPYHYSYGYEVYSWKTGLGRSHYESRYGDVAVGTYIFRDTDGTRSVVDYTVDTPNGFYAVLHKDFYGRSVNFGYARLGGPLAYGSHPAKEVYASRTTLVPDPAVSDNPLIKEAYRTHMLAVNYFDISAPFNMSRGYELTDSQTGRRTSQYEAYFGEIGEGRHTQVEADGTRNSIDYTISPAGFAVASPETFAEKANPLL